MEAENLSLIIGAGSAIAGAAVSQAFSLLQLHLERKNQERVVLREKYEELSRHLNDSLAWSLAILPDASTAEVPLAAPLPPRRAYALTLLYFPLLQPEARAFLHAASVLYLSTESARRDNANKELLVVAVNAGEDFRNKLDVLDNRMQQLARSYTGI